MFYVYMHVYIRCTCLNIDGCSFCNLKRPRHFHKLQFLTIFMDLCHHEFKEFTSSSIPQDGTSSAQALHHQMQQASLWR